jgi:glycosyltransferase involved in cell wall biosynthesis
MVSERVKNVHFTIVGGGPAEEYYKKRAKEEGVGHLFTFVGSVKPEEVLRYYYNADIFVFPSIFETQGLSGLEAMACGLPVAGADYLAIPDFVKDGYNGYLFDPFDVDDCAEKIVKTIGNRKKLRKGAIATGEKYALRKCTADLAEVYYKVLKEKAVKMEKRKGRIGEGLDGAREKVGNLMNSIKKLREKIRI